MGLTIGRTQLRLVAQGLGMSESPVSGVDSYDASSPEGTLRRFPGAVPPTAERPFLSYLTDSFHQP
jgi:hypothetical protein